GGRRAWRRLGCRRFGRRLGRRRGCGCCGCGNKRFGRRYGGGRRWRLRRIGRRWRLWRRVRHVGAGAHAKLVEPAVVVRHVTTTILAAIDDVEVAAGAAVTAWGNGEA